MSNHRPVIAFLAVALASLWGQTPVYAATVPLPTQKAAAFPALIGTGQSTAQAATPAPAPEADDEPLSPPPQTSTEQGQTHMDESFTHADWVRETRRKALDDTKFDLQLRSYYLDRNKYDGSDSEAWALGGSAGFKTGYFRERFALGVTGYTSQKVIGDEDKDGTLLLAPGQNGYTVIGELYGEFLLTEDTRLSIGRRGFDTPYINRNDSRMTPNTFESVLVLGQYGGDGEPELRVGGGYVHSIKERTSTDFVSMAEDAGALDGVDRGVYMVGANYKQDNWSLGAVDYYSDDIINIFYTEGKYRYDIDDDRRLQFALQYTHQSGVGDELLRGEDFSAYQWGAKAEYGVGGLLLTAAYTSASGDDNVNMQNPWSGYPGYTSVQVEDFNRAGEDAWLLRAGYTFESVKGLSVYGLYVDGSDPDDPAQFAKTEYDLNVQWSPPEGTLKGLMVRLRYSQQTQDDPLSQEQDDLRIMVYYEPPVL